MSSSTYLGWFGIFRLGLIQASLGAIIVLTTSVLNRVMHVELALPAMLPGALIAIHHTVQLMRPRMGYGSDLGGRHTPWIIGGMAVLASGGILAALATALLSTSVLLGTLLAALAFLTIGVGVGATGTVLLVLMAKQVDPSRRAAAATTVWIMMIAGFIVSTAVAGHLLDPFSLSRLIAVIAVIAGGAFLLTTLAMLGLERPVPVPTAAEDAEAKTPFLQALSEIWREQEARLFTVFVFLSMLAYGAQDLVLEPFAGLVFGMTPGESTLLSSTQNKGVLLGMVVIGALCSGRRAGRFGSVRSWTIGGCLASALTLGLLAFSGSVGPGWPIESTVFALGLANGIYAVGAITSMMQLASHGRAHREGMRMGLWGAAQAIAMGLGMFLGTVAVDVVRALLESSAAAFATVFAAQAAGFVLAALLATQIARPAQPGSAVAPVRGVTADGRAGVLTEGPA
jgi:BCD family chlorophyll transporter-like MFS transporter